MNVYALSTLIQATESDVDNLIRIFEGRKPQYPLLEHKGELYELVPTVVNPPDPDFLIDEGEQGGGVREVYLQQQQQQQSPAKPLISTAEAIESIEAREGMIYVEGEWIVSPVGSVNGSPDQKDGRGGSIGGGGGANDTPRTYESTDTLLLEEIARKKKQEEDGELAHAKGFALPVSYECSLAKILEMARAQPLCFEESDLKIIEDLFCLVDSRGFAVADIREVMVPFAVIVAKKSIRQVMELVFRLFDREETTVLDKRQFLRVFTLMNEAIFYFGDRPLEATYTTDLVDSIFTTAGKIDGAVVYSDYVELIEQHPIIEMLISPQFQGLTRDKVADEATLREMNIAVDIDYSDKTKK